MANKPTNSNGAVRRKRIVFNIILAALISTSISIYIRHRLQPKPPASLGELLAKVDLPVESLKSGMKEGMSLGLPAQFEAAYGIDLDETETAQYYKISQDFLSQLDLKPILERVMKEECGRRDIPESELIRQLADGFNNPEERAKIVEEWSGSMQKAVLSSPVFVENLEPVYRGFFAWWTPRHPEYEGLASYVRISKDRADLIQQLAVSMRRELVVKRARRLSELFEQDLRKRGKVISNAKLKQAFAVFIAMSKEDYPVDFMQEMAQTIADENKLTEDELLFGLLLSSQPLSVEKMAQIQDVQVRFLTPRQESSLSAEKAAFYRAELQKISGVVYSGK